ncbi:hypothetical protein [Chitiniphilus eburneus]|uniref:hypothetical protein n=1 Tax=Chitiniphilus eburneus TaxID=2571148 RepID=UPI00145F1182|nr:hypothetical protein [Chitiniphilus eburneus]
MNSHAVAAVIATASKPATPNERTRVPIFMLLTFEKGATAPGWRIDGRLRAGCSTTDDGHGLRRAIIQVARAGPIGFRRVGPSSHRVCEGYVFVV